MQFLPFPFFKEIRMKINKPSAANMPNQMKILTSITFILALAEVSMKAQLNWRDRLIP